MLRLVALSTLLSSLLSAAAYACGCFTPPDPTVPVVQAGEKILFAVKEGQVTAHVQVQYQGDAAEFGWLLPLPSVPTLELGIDELFTQLTLATQPKYRMVVVPDRSCNGGGSAGGSSSSGGAGGSGGSSGSVDAGSGGVVVVQDSVGPYDYAVLKADAKTEMLAWLAANHYFVPAGTDDSVAPYIHSGAFFLALKLRSGQSTGDLQPVVLRYASDVGMIPITLTSTGATENMGVQVWMLGQGRAIPRNYHHTVLNDAVVDWRSAGANYQDVIIRAAGEAPGKHTFVTEYAGTSALLRDRLAPAWRFGVQSELAAQPDASAFRQYLLTHGFTYGTTLQTIVERAGAFDAAARAQEVWDRVVTPTRNAQALLDASPVLTRLYTTISPTDMNRDPVFSFNPELPGVGFVHQAEMRVSCTGPYQESTAVLHTEQGWTVPFPAGRFAQPGIDLEAIPASLRIEVLDEEGPPAVVTDNTPMIAAATHLVVPPVGVVPQTQPAAGGRGFGCSITGAGVALLAAVLLLARASRSRAG